MSDYDGMLAQSEASAKAEDERRAQAAADATKQKQDRLALVRAKIDELVIPELQRAKAAFEAAGRHVEIRHREPAPDADMPWVEFQVGYRPDPMRLDIKDYSDCYVMFSWSSGRVVGWLSRDNSSVARPNEGEFLGGVTDADTFREGIRRTLDGNTRRRQQMGIATP